MKDDVWVVVFYKVEDGSIRELKCSINRKYLSKRYQRMSGMRRDVLPVWDLEANDWRSFRFDHFIKMVPWATAERRTKGTKKAQRKAARKRAEYNKRRREKYARDKKKK